MKEIQREQASLETHLFDDAEVSLLATVLSNAREETGAIEVRVEDADDSYLSKAAATCQTS